MDWETYRNTNKEKHLGCFGCASCSFQCPNIIYGSYDIDISDYGYEYIDCDDCGYNDYSCDECLFKNCKECPEYKI